MLVTLPCVLLLLDYWPLARIQGWSEPSAAPGLRQRAFGELILEKLPLLLLSGTSCILTVLAQNGAGAVGRVPFPLGARLQNAIYSYAMYVGKALWPAHLTLFYPYAGRSLSIWETGLAALLLVAITAVVLRLRSQRYLLTGWLWFLGTLVPVIGIIQVGNQAMADRYAYMPLIGLFVMAVWAIDDWYKKTQWGGALPAIAAVSLLALLATATFRQISYWRDNLSVWTHALSVTQHNFVAEENLGVALTEVNRVEDAYPYFVRAAEDEPNDPVARLNIGAYLHQHGRVAEAVPQYQLALQLGAEPHLRAATYSNLGSAYSQLGEYAEAKASFEQALRLNPTQAGVWQGMAWVLEKQGDHEGAIQCLARAAQLQPSAAGYLQLSRALAEANHRAEAIAAYEQAMRMDPELKPIEPAAARQPDPSRELEGKSSGETSR